MSITLYRLWNIASYRLKITYCYYRRVFDTPVGFSQRSLLSDLPTDAGVTNFHGPLLETRPDLKKLWRCKNDTDLLYQHGEFVRADNAHTQLWGE